MDISFGFFEGFFDRPVDEKDLIIQIAGGSSIDCTPVIRNSVNQNHLVAVTFGDGDKVLNFLYLSKKAREEASTNLQDQYQRLIGYLSKGEAHNISENLDEIITLIGEKKPTFVDLKGPNSPRYMACYLLYL